MAEGIHGPAADQTFAGAAVQCPRIDSLQKIGERTERPFGLPRRDDGVHRIFSHVLHPCKAEENALALRGEVGLASVDIRRGDRHLMAAAVLDIPAHLSLVPVVAGHHGRHELRPVMGLQIRRLPGDPSVADTVRFIESIPRKMHHQIENVIGRILFHAVFQRAVHEEVALLLQNLRLLMPHGAAEQICLSQTEAAHDGGNAHDLFLIEDDPVGLLQDRLQQRMGIFHGNPAVLAVDEILRHAAPQRPRAVQGHHRDQVLEALRLQLHQKAREPRRF